MKANLFGHLRRAPVCCPLILFWLTSQLTAVANPSNGTVTQGQANIVPSGSTLNINQTSANAFINWQSFDIGSGETVNFNQPSSSSLTWNYVSGGTASTIDGAMNANGIVVLQNPNGISIGGSATITAHGLIMTTAATPALNFSSSGPWSFTAPSPSAKIVNVGQINITGGGTAYLIASDIENDGTISAPNGSIGLYAGEQVLVSTRPDGKGLSAQVTLPEGSVDNQGNLVASAGSIMAQAQTVNVSGMVEANSAQNVNGTIELVAGDTLTVNPGATVSAEGNSHANGGGVVLQAGNTINNNGSVIADGSLIEATAPAINQDGLLQANSLGVINGIVQFEAGGSLNLGAGSQISAIGDATSASASAGGFVILDAGGAYTDVAGSTISLGGNAGGQGGILEFIAPGLKANQLKSTLAGYFLRLVNPQNITFSTGASKAGTVNTTVNINDLSAYSQIELWALDNMTVSTFWLLSNPAVPSVLSLTAGNSLIVDDGCGIGSAAGGSGFDWDLNLTAGTQIPGGTTFISNMPADPDNPNNSALNPNYGIYLEGDGDIFTQSGNINLWAANEVYVGGEDIGGITTFKGGNISVTAQNGSVYTGDNVNGYDFPGGYTVDFSLGGISTAAGGNVTINAGEDVISYLPVQNNWSGAAEDPGSGAFGPEPGNVTITAGGNVYGHYVVANGVGTITAGGDVGVPLTSLNQDDGFSLSLIDGSWSVSAPHGSIYVQDINNPNGIFNENNHSFDYSPTASILLDAAQDVEITGFNAPQATPDLVNAVESIPIILPGSLTVEAGGNLTLDSTVILFPSPEQLLNLDVGGDLLGTPGGLVNLEMSDSAATQWTGKTSFGTGDHAATPPEINNPNPVEINVGGNIENLNFYVDEAAQVTVGQNMINSSFLGENLHAGDVTSLNVGGSIEYSPLYSFVGLSSGIISSEASQPETWDSVFDYAINPGDVAKVNAIDFNSPAVQQAITADGGLPAYLDALGYLEFPSTSKNQFEPNLGFVYDPNSHQLGFQGNLTASVAAQLENNSFDVLVVNAQGNPILTTGGNLQTTPYSFNIKNWAADIATLYTESLNDENASSLELGLQIGGPGKFNVTAGSINLGGANGIISAGFGTYQFGSPDYATLEGLCGTVDSGGAAVNVTVTSGDLDMINSAICSLDGGNVNVNVASGAVELSPGAFVFPIDTCYGIWTSGHSDVSVTANGDINIGSSRIATFNGGNVLVESYNGDVDCGFGANIALDVPGIAILNGVPTSVEFGNLQNLASLLSNPAPYGSGILSEYPTLKYQTPGASGPGNITVETPNGNINSLLGGISQFALDAKLGAGPTVTLVAGTTGVPATADEGNILLGNGLVLGGNVSLKATGKIQAAVISQHNTEIVAPAFSGIILSGGTVSGQVGSMQGVAVGISGIDVQGNTSGATLLSQNVSVNGAAQSTLGTSANATAASQAAAQQSSGLAASQATVVNNGDEDRKKKKKATVKVGRVTVILSTAVPGH
jgi:filamentous hemagglutinin family protein